MQIIVSCKVKNNLKSKRCLKNSRRGSSLSIKEEKDEKMSEIKISANVKDVDFFCDLKEKLNDIEEKNTLQIRNEDFDIGDARDELSLSCIFEDDDIKLYVSDILADCIILNYENNIIEKIIEKEYSFLKKTEKAELKEIVREFLNNKNIQNCTFKTRSRNLIVRQLIDYLKKSDTILIEGFINFRLKDYIENLKELIENVLEDYLENKEYKEFLALLKYFVEIQESKTEFILISANKSGELCMIDADGDEVIGKYLCDLDAEYLLSDIDEADAIISILISVAPKKIYIENEKLNLSNEIMKTLNIVFEGRILAK